MSPIATSALPLLPLDAGVVLPGMTITLALETPEARAAAEAASGAGNRLVLVPRLGRTSGPDASSGRFARVGHGRPGRAHRRPAGRHPGGGRAGPGAGHHRRRHRRRRPGPLGERRDRRRAGGHRRRDRERPASCGPCSRPSPSTAASGRLGDILRGVTDPGRLADTAGYWPELSVERKVELLETLDPTRRVELVLAWGREALAELELKDRIRTDVAEGMERTQREYLLRQQLAAIRKELGEQGDGERRRRLPDPAGGPDGQRRHPDRHRHARSTSWSAPASRAPSTAGSGPGSTLVFELPWGVRSDDRLDIGEARAVLDADHTGLDDVKERIIEHLAVRKLRVERGPRRRPSPGSGRGRRRHDPYPGRSARRGQDLARRVCGPRHGPHVRPGRPRRRPGRGRDPRSPAHLRGRPARPHRAGHQGRRAP